MESAVKPVMAALQPRETSKPCTRQPSARLKMLQRSMVGMTGFFRRARISSTATGSSSTGFQTNRASSCSMMICAVSGRALLAGANSMPSMVKRIAAKIQAGIVVQSWERM